MLRVPEDRLTSPQDSSPVKLDGPAHEFHDTHGNTWTALAASRPANAIKKWLKRNFPRR